MFSIEDYVGAGLENQRLKDMVASTGQGGRLAKTGLGPYIKRETVGSGEMT